jgi:large subunit ribosomal protein L22
VKAFLKNYRQSPRKVRLVAGVIKQKNVAEALALLGFVDKKAALPMKKLLASAVANAKARDTVNPADLYVKEIRVDKGLTLKRGQSRSRGMVNPIHKHSSHITLVLGERAAKAPKVAPATLVADVSDTEAKAPKKPSVKRASKKA